MSLLAYVGVVAVVHVPWPHALGTLVVPDFEWNAAYATGLVAILGTTISPYPVLLAGSAGDQRGAAPSCPPTAPHSQGSRSRAEELRTDTLMGMAFNTIVSVEVVFATAATLHLFGDRRRNFCRAALNLVGVSPIKALYWAAVVNGVLAAPLMALMMMIVSNRKAMGPAGPLTRADGP
ncbi:divalent metal cation transporter [Sphingomonas sp. GCM10030256]|uniref:divalent metal cation transporter n=1 Tax=Sphingomonas sp. GCM10030256 TaxID=3273427 RepID=UPI00361CD6B6